MCSSFRSSWSSSGDSELKSSIRILQVSQEFGYEASKGGLTEVRVVAAGVTALGIFVEGHGGHDRSYSFEQGEREARVRRGRIATQTRVSSDTGSDNSLVMQASAGARRVASELAWSRSFLLFMRKLAAQAEAGKRVVSANWRSLRLG